MPYIKANRRFDLEPELLRLVKLLRGRDVGDMSYAITVLLTEWAESPQPSYTKYNAALGVLDAIGKELYRTRIAPYEDKQAEQNGMIIFSADEYAE